MFDTIGTRHQVKGEILLTIDSTTFRQALGRFASGVTVVTMKNDGLLSGLTVSAFCSLSLTPPRVLVCIDKSSTNINPLRKSKAFAVNVLSQSQADISTHFAKQITDKFTGISYRIGPFGLPLLNDSLCNLECKLIQEIDGGDHYIYIGEIEHAEFHENKEPLVYYRGNYGHFHS